MYPVWYLDAPDMTKSNPDPVMFEVKGWVAAIERVEHIAFTDKVWTKLLPISFHPRPDVESAYHLPTTGFQAACRFDQVRGLDSLSLNFETNRQTYEIVVPVHSGQVDPLRQKAAKLDAIFPLLQCPQCRSGELKKNSTTLTCAHCQSTFPCSPKHYDFLSESFRKAFDIVDTSNVSANHYDGVALNYIHRFRHGLILDCGAGYREKYYDNVINYEIVPYDSTDVLGVAEKLPFKNGSFDVVFSFAVLEHVKNPFDCARELIRVLKPGGQIYCEVPFLQPLHGYPHHYYNMTREGLANVFKGLLQVERLETLNFGQPVFTLTWFLNRYLAGLPAGNRGSFMEMKVKDLIQPGNAYLGSPFVTGLSDAARDELSCCNLIIGTKP